MNYNQTQGIKNKQAINVFGSNKSDTPNSIDLGENTNTENAMNNLLQNAIIHKQDRKKRVDNNINNLIIEEPY